MKLFEAIIIFAPRVDFKKKLKEYEQVFKESMDYIYLKDMGIKHLAYPQKKYKTGHYALFYFNSTSDWVSNRLNEYCKKDDDVLKFLTTKMNKLIEDFDELERIDLIKQNKKIDAMDVILGLAEYEKKE